jgi:uncharacterized protein DUF7003
MIQHNYDSEEILSQLDGCAKEFTFPVLDNGYFYPITTRLNVFRDDMRWALIIEVIGFNHRAGGHYGIYNALHCYGNCINTKPGLSDENLLNPTQDANEEPTFDDEYGFYLRPEATKIRIKDTVIPVNHNCEFYVSKGIELSEPPKITIYEFLRGLLPEQRELLLATKDELKQRLTTQIPLILQLDEWHHPDLANDELPSGNATFQMITKVLVTGDRSLYQPQTPPNTHWSNWPEGGEL